MSIRKGFKLTHQHKQKLSLAHKGKVLSEEHKRRIALSYRGKGMLGHKHTEESKKLISLFNSGDFSSQWKGNKVGYSGIHKWVTKCKGNPKSCEKCGTINVKRYEWANIDHKYRRVLDDYIRLCCKCHRDYDLENNLRFK